MHDCTKKFKKNLQCHLHESIGAFHRVHKLLVLYTNQSQQPSAGMHFGSHNMHYDEILYILSS